MHINDMNMVVFWVCVAIGAAVYGVIIWSLIAYRKSSKHKEGESFHRNTAVEIAWTVIPLVIIIVMTIPAARLLTRLTGSGDQGGMHFEPVDNNKKEEIALMETGGHNRDLTGPRVGSHEMAGSRMI